MPGTACGREAAGWRCDIFTDLAALPDACGGLFAAPQDDLQASLLWYRTTIETALPDGTTAQLVLCRQNGRPVALFPMQRDRGGALHSLTTPYTLHHRPLFAADASPAMLRTAGRLLGALCRRHATIRLDALRADWPGLAPLRAGLNRAGLLVQSFDHFGNWHVPVAGLDWDAYLAGRPGALRETVRRKLRRLQRDGRITFDLAATPAEVAAAIAAYEAVYARSWKEPEPFPRFNAAFLQATAAAGLLRLGVLRHDGQPMAAQYWCVGSGTATVLKLAHDEAFATVSPGTVLTAMMIRTLLERETILDIDFGRGDDPYKKLWTDRRRQRIGWILVNPLRPAGLAMVGRRVLQKVRPSFLKKRSKKLL